MITAPVRWIPISVQPEGGTSILAMMFKPSKGAERTFVRHKGRMFLAKIVSGSVITDGLEPPPQAIAV